MKVLRVRNWSEHFENNRTKGLKNLRWVPMPNKHDGDGYCELLDHPNGVAHYGVWVLIVQVASRCEATARDGGGRGTLLRDDGTPYDFTSLARRTRGNPEIFKEGIARLLKIQWLEEIDLEVVRNQTDKPIPQETAVPPQVNAVPPQDVASSRARAGASIPSIPSIPSEGECEGVKRAPLEEFAVMQAELSAMYGRPANAPWSCLEQQALAEICNRPGVAAEFAELKAGREKDSQYFPRSVSNLLQNWTSTLDSIRNPNYGNHQHTGQQRNLASVGTANEGRGSAYANAPAIKRGVAGTPAAVPSPGSGAGANGTSGH